MLKITYLIRLVLAWGVTALCLGYVLGCVGLVIFSLLYIPWYVVTS